MTRSQLRLAGAFSLALWVAAFAVGAALADAPVEAPMPPPRPEMTEGHAAPVHPVRVLSLANALLNDGDAMFCRGRIVLALRGACTETAEVRNITPTTVGQIGGTE